MDYYQGFTKEEAEKVKKLERKLLKRGLLTGARNAACLVLAVVSIIGLDINYIHNDKFLFCMGLISGILFIRQIHVDIKTENDMLEAGLREIFKVKE
jgi:hypothetical protein